jgi:uncharacterized membrane protein YeaQ/YmgE (transglycosylase-associated protein family)
LLSEHESPSGAAVALNADRGPRGRAALPENVMIILGIVGWVVIGLIVGFIGNKAVNLRGDDPRFGIFSACAGAIVAGGLYSLFSGSGVTAWNPGSLVSAAIGAAAGAVIWHAVRSRSISKGKYTTRSSY